MTVIPMVPRPDRSNSSATGGTSRFLGVALAFFLLIASCSMEGDDVAVTPDGVDKKPDSTAPMPSGHFVGAWPDDPGAFANNSRATGTFELITVDVSGETWQIATSYSTTVPVGGNCFVTVTHTISGDGPVMPDGGGPLLLGDVADMWVRERGGEGCSNPSSDSGDDLASVNLSYVNGELDGWIEGHNVTLTAG